MATFAVDPRLASLLGENYRSTEQALKELVDNAWDADADNVWITLPNPELFTKDPIIVQDDGSGMTEKEISKEYLVIANGRYSRYGERTPNKKRLVKGRKGIGKFAGLMIANLMTVETKARGILSNLSIPKQKLLDASVDLEEVNLTLETKTCNSDEHGTSITLSELNQNLAFPNPEKLRQLLVFEYGRETDFNVFVNGQLLSIEDIPGQTIEVETELPLVGPVKLKFKVSDGNKPLKQSGIVVRVGGKIIGKPTYFGLNEAEDFPNKLLKKVYGEIEADGLADDVTADWGAIIENSNAYQELQKWTEPQLRTGIGKVYKKDLDLAKARLQRQINQRLEQLPEYRRPLAQSALERILHKFYGESEEKIDTIISVVLDAFERDEYWTVLQNIENAKKSDVETFAEALGQFGLLDLAIVGQQTRHRLHFLDDFDELIIKPETLEKTTHKALESNLWVFGTEYSMMSSNKTLSKVIEEYTNKNFSGERAKKRPDLLLASDVTNRFLLIEFKRPSLTLTRDEENQAIKYRDDLDRKFNAKIEVLVIGKDVDPNISARYDTPGVKMISYSSLINNARNQLNWLIEEIKKDSS